MSRLGRNIGTVMGPHSWPVAVCLSFSVPIHPTASPFLLCERSSRKSRGSFRPTHAGLLIRRTSQEGTRSTSCPFRHRWAREASGWSRKAAAARLAGGVTAKNCFTFRPIEKSWLSMSPAARLFSPACPGRPLSPLLLRINPYSYDVTADGKRFLIVSAPANTPPITVVLNWQAGLKK